MLDEHASSDFDEDSFLPSYRHGPTDGMPSISQFDSIMEPLDDEFHAGLNFQKSNSLDIYLNKSQFHSHSDNVMDTDEDVDDIPFEGRDEVDYQKHIFNNRNTSAGSRQFKKVETNSLNSNESPVYAGFEFLDQSELQDVTDEEINQQNFGDKSKLAEF